MDSQKKDLTTYARYLPAFALISSQSLSSLKGKTLVNSLKGISSLMIRKKNYPNIRKKLWGGALQSPSSFAGSCSGAPISVICKYIKQRQAPH